MHHLPAAGFGEGLRQHLSATGQTRSAFAFAITRCCERIGQCALRIVANAGHPPRERASVIDAVQQPFHVDVHPGILLAVTHCEYSDHEIVNGAALGASFRNESLKASLQRSSRNEDTDLPAFDSALTATVLLSLCG
jgi:hypothetical protein